MLPGKNVRERRAQHFRQIKTLDSVYTNYSNTKYYWCHSSLSRTLFVHDFEGHNRQDIHLLVFLKYCTLRKPRRKNRSNSPGPKVPQVPSFFTGWSTTTSAPSWAFGFSFNFSSSLFSSSCLSAPILVGWGGRGAVDWVSSFMTALIVSDTRPRVSQCSWDLSKKGSEAHPTPTHSCQLARPVKQWAHWHYAESLSEQRGKKSLWLAGSPHLS